MMAALLVLLVSLVQAATPGTGTIRGRVVDRDTGLPLFRAMVRVTPSGGKTDERVAHTDERGIFAIEGLAPARYNGVVTARQHAPQPIGTGPIALAKDQVVDVVVRLAPTYGLDVGVVDPSGVSLSGIQVQAMPVDDGRPQVSSMLNGTDDLGHVRLFGLRTGRYVICADSQTAGLPTVRAGTRSDRLLRTCYPSADEGDAEPVSIDRADLDGIEIRMRRGRTFSISGTVLDASGAPAPLATVGFVRYIPNGSSSLSVTVDASGRFRVVNVPPGTYGIEARIPDPGRPMESKAIEAAFVEVTVGEANVNGLVVGLGKTVDVQGRIVVSDGTSTLPASPGSGLFIDAALAAAQIHESGGAVHAFARSDRTFTLSGLFGARVLRFENVPRGWYVKAVRYGDREILDVPLEFRSGRDAPALEVIVSNRGAVVSGTVVEDAGTPAGRSMLYLLRLSGKRGVELADTARATAAGTFSIGPVRAGEYALVAFPLANVPGRASRERLSLLAGLGERLTLTDLDERGVRLYVARER
jgi:hypothetical protein